MFEIIHNNKVVSVNSNRIVELPDDATFAIKIFNNLRSRLEMSLYLNGKVGNKNAFVGCFIIEPNKSATIERGVNSNSLFTFKAKNSDVNLSEIISTEQSDWGLVSARFRNEAFSFEEEGLTEYCDNTKEFMALRSVKGISTGGIVGSGHSNQVFNRAEPIFKYGDLDMIYAVRINLKKYTSLTDNIPHYNYP